MFGDLAGLHMIRDAFQTASFLPGEAGRDDPIDLAVHTQGARQQDAPPTRAPEGLEVAEDRAMALPQKC